VEWLEYHMLLGVQYFFIITNDCPAVDNAASTAVLQPYIDAGVVYLDRRYQCASVFQKKAYRASYRALNLARTAKWIGCVARVLRGGA
jgi:hypothetical protein